MPSRPAAQKEKNLSFLKMSLAVPRGQAANRNFLWLSLLSCSFSIWIMLFLLRAQAQFLLCKCIRRETLSDWPWRDAAGARWARQLQLWPQRLSTQLCVSTSQWRGRTSGVQTGKIHLKWADQLWHICYTCLPKTLKKVNRTVIRTGINIDFIM